MNLSQTWQQKLDMSGTTASIPGFSAKSGGLIGSLGSQRKLPAYLRPVSATPITTACNALTSGSLLTLQPKTHCVLETVLQKLSSSRKATKQEL